MGLEIYTEHVPRTAVTETTIRKLSLPFESRQKARQRARLDNGEEVGLQLPRGITLRGGDVVRSADGADDVLIEAASEPVSTVHAHEASALARVAYHLGNRHVWLEVGDGWVRYLSDPVLDDMVRQMGYEVIGESAPFEPETGAYHGLPHNSETRHGHAH